MNPANNLKFLPDKPKLRFRLIAPSYPAFNIYSDIARITTALGPVCVATIVNRMDGWEVEVIDENNYRRFGPKDAQGKPDHGILQALRPADVVGFYGGLTSTIPRLYELAHYYEQFPGTIVIAGGQHFVGENIDDALRNGIDYVVFGEGEETIHELLGALRGNRDPGTVAGIAFLREGQVVQTPRREPLTDFERLPMPDFSLVRYATARQAPTMGSLWFDPPGCFAAPAFSPVIAFYAQATWNAAAAASEVRPEPALAAAAQHATSGVLWRRRTLTFPGGTALLLSPSGPKRQPVATAPQQFSGVPLAAGHPVVLEPLPEGSKPLASAEGAASVRLLGGTILSLDGANADRHEDQLILCGAPRERTGTNIYGAEVMVGAEGVVQEVSNGVGDHAVPAGGFVLSAHGGRVDQVLSLRPGDRVAVLDAQGQWLGGSEPALLFARLPEGRVLRIDGEDTGRGANQLIIYHAGYRDGHTETNQYGVEVAVRAGKVEAVHDGTSDSAIPADGYVLSVHQGAESTAAAFRALRPGDAIALLWEKGGTRQDLDATLAARGRRFPVGARCSALYLAVSSGRRSSSGAPLGEWLVRYEDGAVERIPCRYGRDVLSIEVDALPESLSDPVWLVEENGQRFLVREWTNPRPEQAVKELVFVPAPAVLEAGARIVAVTAAAAP